MTWSFAIPLVLFVLIFIVRMPIAFGLLLMGVYYFLFTGQTIGLVAESALSNLYDQYVIIAVPLFIFTANVLNRAGITDRIFNWLNSFIARYRGGLGHVTVVDSMIYAGMTGSSVAEAAGLGKMEITAMKKFGYPGGFSCALAASASVMGALFPPSIPFVIYALLSGASLGALFLGGIVPGILYGVGLMVYVVIASYRRGFPLGQRYSLRQFLSFTVRAFPALLTPVILLGGMYSGVMTATEAGAVAGLYALLLSVFVYRSLGWRDTWEILVDTVRMTGMLSIMVGGAFVFDYIVVQQGLPGVIANLMLSLPHSKFLFLAIVNISFLLIGTVLDTGIVLLIFLPIIVPVVNALGISLIQFGVVIVLNAQIGLCLPPHGTLLLVTSGVSDTPLRDVIREIWPQILAVIVVLALITYVPEIVLWLPNHLGPR